MELSMNTADVQNASSQLKNRSEDMRSAIQTAENAIAPLRSFKSPRLSRDLGTWDEIKATFLKNLDTLVESAQELARAAEANEAANN